MIAALSPVFLRSVTRFFKIWHNEIILIDGIKYSLLKKKNGLFKGSTLTKPQSERLARLCGRIGHQPSEKVFAIFFPPNQTTSDVSSEKKVFQSDSVFQILYFICIFLAFNTII